MQKGFSAIIVMVSLVAIVIIAGGLVLFNKSTTSKVEPKVSTPSVEQASPSATISDLPASASAQNSEIVNWKTYMNTQYGYSIKYPSEWSSGTEDGLGWFIAPGGQPGYGHS